MCFVSDDGGKRDPCRSGGVEAPGALVNYRRPGARPANPRDSKGDETVKFETIHVEAEGNVGRLTLQRPERLNALGATMMREIRDAAGWFDRQRAVRIVIVRGAGRAFSAGADLKDSPVSEAVPREGGLDWAERREVGQIGLRMADAVEQMRAVTIAQVHGYAVGRRPRADGGL
jgi:1,4-dihydroxy-2-naphthoyl-CoA synthase